MRGILGFDAIGFCDATLPEEARTRLRQFVEDGRHGTMSWMEQRIRPARRPQGALARGSQRDLTRPVLCT